MAEAMWMRRALDLAEHGRGHVEPNPLVGAVVVRDGHIVGEGFHQRFGEAHAEVNALAAAGDNARGATLLVTLEPCCHHGKTPPCTDAILRAGVTRVVAAMPDPFPRVAGGGFALLRAAGITVEVGLMEAEARRLNAPYLRLLADGRPWVHAKWAMTLDGKICTRTGDSKWISGEASRRRVHELRGRMDAMIVGIGTVLADDPLLTARPLGPRVATRVILDSQGRLPVTSWLVQSAATAPVLVATTSRSGGTRETLNNMGIEVVDFEETNGRPSVTALMQELGRRRMTNLLIEGGAEVLGSFLDAGLVDEAHVFIAPLLVGGTMSKTPIGGHGVAGIAEALRFPEASVERIDGDIYWHGWR